VRWKDHLRALIKPQPHRQIQLAVLRGRKHGIEWLQKNL
jgi:hypothetical protein